MQQTDFENLYDTEFVRKCADPVFAEDVYRFIKKTLAYQETLERGRMNFSQSWTSSFPVWKGM